MHPAFINRRFFVSIMLKFTPIFRFFALTLALGSVNAWGVNRGEEPLDRIVAVVENGVILESELNDHLLDVKQRFRQSTQLPPDSILERQVLENMILEKIQLHLAERAGIKIDEETLRAAIQEIAHRNNISMEDFPSKLRAQGINYTDFIERIRGEMAVQRLRASQINSPIKVSDREVENYLKTQGDVGMENEYLLGHILIATPRAASPADVQKAKEKADKLAADIRKGLDFRQAALGASDDERALKGGDLGWRKKNQIPSLFTDFVDKMKEGDVEGPIRSSSGFHIIKMLGVKGVGDHMITKSHVRHILIKLKETVSDQEAKQKLLALRHRIENGEDFAAIARAYSEDYSSIKGGDLGWVKPGDMVPPFEAAMSQLAINQLSEPVQTQFGWHLIQVLERQQTNDSGDLQKKQAHDEILKRKIDEETELWLRRIRDEAYVEIRLDGR